MQKAILVALCASAIAAAQSVSLFLPLFDPQPLTADVAGVGASGQTTWLVRGSGDGFIGTGTLVQGPAGATFTFQAPEPTPMTLGYQCSFTGGDAVCVGADPESNGDPVTTTESLEYLPVQLGTTVSGVHATSSSTPAGSSATITSRPSGTSSTATTRTSGAPSSTQASSSISQKQVSVSVLLFMFGMSLLAVV